MGNKIRTNTKLLYVLLVMLVMPFEAYAYLDPGTGGILIQAFIVILISGSVFFKHIKTKVKDIFDKIKGSNKSEEEHEEKSDE